MKRARVCIWSCLLSSGTAWVALAAMLLCGSCSPWASAPIPGQVTDAGDAAVRRARADATSRNYVVKRATAELSSVRADDMSFSGSATWQTTLEGVDLEVALKGCTTQTYSIEITEASDCSHESLEAPIWRAGRGANIPDVYCNLGRVAMIYSRRAGRADAWSIDEAPESELVGHGLLVRRTEDGEPVACGVITRGEDGLRQRPSAASGSSVEAQATLVGLCLARQFPNAGPSCPDPAGLVQCANVHCDTADCVAACESYTRCRAATGDVCALAACELTPECSQCQDELSRCGMGYCGKHLTCGPTITPGGPCQRVGFCCALQGTSSNGCLGLVVPLAASFGGDANCVGAMNDWDVLSHLHVPCTYGAPADDAGAPDAQELAPELPQSAEAMLADDAVGKPCSEDAECPGGVCARAAPGDTGTSSAGYCSRACVTSSECGTAGICVALPQHAGKRCLPECQQTADCRDGFVCAGNLEGSTLNLPGSCRPARAVGQLADGVAGRACSDDAACSGGQCAHTTLLGTTYPGNYCTATCYLDEQCGQTGVCLWPKGSVDPGYCLQRCETQDDCTRDGYRCWQLGDGERTLRACYPGATPLPDHTAGKPCESQSDCGAEHATCEKELPYAGLTTNELVPAPDGYCTQHCALDLECGAGSQCVNYGTQGGICLANCTQSSDCRSGYTCYLHGRDHDPEASVCIPSDPTQ